MFVTKPENELNWTVRDFKTAKLFAKTLDYPQNPKISLWDHLNTPWNDSVHILNEINKIIRNEKTKS